MPPEVHQLPSVQAAFLYDKEGEAAIARYAVKHETIIARMATMEKLLRVGQMCLWAPLVFGALMVACSRAQMGDASWLLSCIVTVCFLVLTGLWAASSGHWTQYLIRLRNVAGDRGQVGERAEFEATARGVKLGYADAAQEFGWKYIDRVVRVEQFIAFLYAGSTNGIPVPLSAFAHENDALAFEQSARALLEASGYDNRTRVRATLASRSIRCDQCSYELKGVAETQCPECGRPLNVLTLRCLEYLQVPLWKRLLAPRRVTKELSVKPWG